MALSTQRAVSDGTLQDLLLEIEYIDRDNIRVFVDNVLQVEGVDYDWTTDTMIHFTSPIADTLEAFLRRDTEVGTVLNIFTQGATFDSPTMDENFKQLLFVAQEIKEGGVLTDLFNDLDMHGFRLKNLADAVDGGDAVTLDQLNAYAADSSAVLRADLANTALASKGAGLVGFKRAPLSTAITTVGGMLSASWVNVWEYAQLITVKPDPLNPLTWDWQPAIQAAVDSGAGVCYFPGPFVYNTESTVVVDKQVRLIADAAKRLGSTIGTRIYNTGVGDAVIYSATGAIYDAGIENLGISAVDGHALNIKYGAVRCYFKQLYLYTQHTGRSCIAGIYNAGTPGVDYIGTYSSVFEGGEYIVDNVPRVAPIIDFLANGTLINGNCFRNLWVTNSNGRPAIRLMATTPGTLLTNNNFDGIIGEVCSGGMFLIQATQGTRIKGARAWDTPAGYAATVILVSNDLTVAQNKGLIIEDYARMSDPLNGASQDIDLGFSLDNTIINHNSNVVGKINFRSRSTVVIGAVNATVTSDAAVTYVTGAALTTIAATIKGALAHTGTTAGFFGKTPVVQPSATGDTTGASLAQLEAVVNGLKQKLRDLGLMAT